MIDPIVGGKYNFKNQHERLVYLGFEYWWHQFAIDGEDSVWAEVKDDELWMIEETMK